jgi:hypothetical protein
MAQNQDGRKSVQDIRFVEQQMRDSALAKQEELRLLVGCVQTSPAKRSPETRRRCFDNMLLCLFTVPDIVIC